MLILKIRIKCSNPHDASKPSKVIWSFFVIFKSQFVISTKKNFLFIKQYF
jgi:hypothetical protein